MFNDPDLEGAAEAEDGVFYGGALRRMTISQRLDGVLCAGWGAIFAECVRVLLASTAWVTTDNLLALVLGTFAVLAAIRTFLGSQSVAWHQGYRASRADAGLEGSTQAVFV